MAYDWYGEWDSYKTDFSADILKLGTVGGIGQLKYHLTRFSEYDWDCFEDGKWHIYPIYEKDRDIVLSYDEIPTGKDLLVNLFNLGKKINDFSEKKPYLDLIIEWCKKYVHPYFINDVYDTLHDDICSSDPGQMIAKVASFELERFMNDLKNLYQATAFCFAFDRLCLGDEDYAYALYEEGKYFDGLPFFEKYKYSLPDESDERNRIMEALLTQGKGVPTKKIKRTTAPDSGNDETSQNTFVRIPFDDYEHLQNTMVDLIPDFHIRLTVDPNTHKAVFAARVDSVFDIAWLTLARKISEDLAPEDRMNEREEKEGVIMTCQFCGDAYVRTKGSRQITCGSPECQKARKAMNKRNSRRANNLHGS